MTKPSMIKECSHLWQDLSWYVWGGTFTRAMRTCQMLDWYKENHFVIYAFTSLIYPFIK